MRIALVVVGILVAASPARAEHRKFAFGVSMGVGVDPDVPEAGLGLAFRIGYRPVEKLAILWTADLSLVDLDPEGKTSAHALVAQIDLHPKIYVLAGPAIGIYNPPSDDGTLTGPGILGAIGVRVAPYASNIGIKADVELELRTHVAWKDGEQFSGILFLAGAGF